LGDRCNYKKQRHEGEGQQIVQAFYCSYSTACIQFSRQST